MTIPNVTFCWCHKAATCKWCGKPIGVAQAMVRVFFWNKGGNNRRWNVQQCYHPQCWLEQGMDYLKRNPFVPMNKKLVLSNEDARKRFLMVRKFNALIQRKKSIKLEYPENILMEARLNTQMGEIMMEIATIGGVPKGWLEKI